MKATAERLSLALAGASGGTIMSVLFWGVLALILFISACAGYFAWEARGLERDLAVANQTIAERDRDVAAANTKATNEARRLEQANADFMARLDAKQKEIEDAKHRSDSTIADLRSGNLRLRHDLSASACASGETASGAGAGMGDESTAGNLWRSSAEAIIRDADEADIVAKQLTACQAIVTEDRRLLRE